MAFAQPDEQVLSTLYGDGSRRWLRPRLSRGRFLTRRRLTAYFLLAIFTVVPYLSLNGKPLVLLDLPARRFTILGFTFLPSDTLLLALFLVMFILSIFLITAMFGRFWCGWMCPQTVYLEFVYRPLERLFDGPPGAGGEAIRKGSPLRSAMKYPVFLLVSVFLAHTFLAYFVGVDVLAQWVRQSPWEHPATFSIMLAATAGMMFNFCYFREQTCIVACPYGRLQSVLLDRNSLIVSYDAQRGEPRGYVRCARGTDAPRGQCVDCRMCVATCPTGIDIRDGLQMECLACAQCIDACDAVMTKLKRPRGLIRYTSQARMAGESGRLLRPRVVLYPLGLAVLAVLFAVVLAGKTTVDVTVLRGLGSPFTVSPEGEVTNQVRIKITNRTDRPASYRVDALPGVPARLIMDQEAVVLAGGESRTSNVLIVTPASVFRQGVCDIQLRISDGPRELHVVEYRLLGPRHAEGMRSGRGPAGGGTEPRSSAARPGDAAVAEGGA